MDSYNGGGTHREDWLYDVKSTKDGGFLAVGYLTDPTTGTHSSVLKLNARGDREWVKSVGNASGDFSIFWDAIETSDGYFLCVGQGKSGGADNLKIAKLDQSGNVTTTLYPSLSSSTSSSVGYGVAEVIGTLTNNVRYVITGGATGTNLSATSSEDIFVLRLDANLSTVGSVTFLGNTNGSGGTYIGNDRGRSVGIIYHTGIDPVLGPQGNADGIVVAGFVEKNNNTTDKEDIYVGMVDFYGTVANSKLINSAGINNTFYYYDEHVCGGGSNPRDNNDRPGRIAQISDGNIVLAAELNHCFCGLGVNTDGVLYKLNKTNLTTTWKKNVSHYSGYDLKMEFVETWDNGFAVGSTTGDCNFVDGLPALPSGIENELLLAKTDASGNVQWRRHFSGTYINPSSNHTCGFGIDLTQDGGFVMCGNNEDNGDNACVLRLSSDCEVNYGSYTAGYTLQTDETWGSKQIKGKIIVPYGKTLTINNGAIIQFAYTREINDHFNLSTVCGIEVQPGGKLVINNATLRGLSSCNRDFYWDGVTLKGNPAESQLPLNNLKQGQLIMSNSAVIRDATVGVNVTGTYWAQATYGNTDYDGSWYYGSTAHRADYYTTGTTDGGGYISASNSKFSNCRVGVGFDKYPATGYNYSEISKFSNCTFECTGPILDPWAIDNDGRKLGNKYFITMWDVHGTRFTSNTFTNTGTFDGDIRGYGINSYDADYSLDATCTLQGECSCIQWATGNQFLHLSEGIYALASSGSALKHTLSVDHSIFTDSYYGDIFVSGITQPLLSITRNTFNLANYETSLVKNYGLYLNACSGYLVTENTLNTSYTNTNYGFVVNDANNDNNEIYKNNFKNLYAGLIAYKQNGGPTNGLSLKCNEFNYGATISSTYDIALVSTAYPFTGGASTPYGSLYTFQGGISCPPFGDPNYHTGPAGNTFFNTCSASAPTRLYADQWASSVSYRFNKSSSPYDPLTCYTSSKYSAIPCNTIFNQDADGRDPDACPSKLGCSNPNLSAGGSGSLLASISYLDQEMSEAKSQDDEMSDEAQQQINDLARQRDQLVYQLVQYYMDTVQVDSAAQLLLAEGMTKSAVPLLIAEGKFDAAQSILDTLSGKDDETLELQSLEQVHLDLAANKKTWLDLSDEQHKTLNEIAATATPSAYQAKNILKMVYNEDFAIDIPYLSFDGKRTAASEISDAIRAFTVYPNPSQGSFTVDVALTESNEIISMEICDMVGRTLQALTLQQGTNNITMAFAPDALLLCKFFEGNVLVYVQPIVVNR